jgi:hypothetical protein
LQEHTLLGEGTLAATKDRLKAYGQLELALSEHSAFRRRSIETRLWWRIGATISHPERVVELHVGSGATKDAAKKAPAGCRDSPRTHHVMV